MGGIDKLAASARGPPLLALGRRRAWRPRPRASRGSSWSTRARAGRRRFATSHGCGVRSDAHGRRRWRAPPGLGGGRRRARPTRTSSSSTTAPGRSSQPALVDRGRARSPRSAARRSRCAGRRCAQAGRRWAIVGTVDRARLVRAQTPRAPARDLLACLRSRPSRTAGDVDRRGELCSRRRASRWPWSRARPTTSRSPRRRTSSVARASLGGAARRRRASARATDSHPFGPGDGLRARRHPHRRRRPRLHGHSDGDVVAPRHRDALLAAAGAGDLGRLFPAGDPATRGVDSRGSSLAEVVGDLRRAGWQRDRRVDLTIRGARPAPRRARASTPCATPIAELVGPRAERVAVKASTGNLSGERARGRTITATCLVQVRADR